MNRFLVRPAAKIRRPPALEDAVVPSDHRAPEPGRPELALVHRDRASIRHDPYLLRDAGREDGAVDDAEDQDQSQHGDAAEHGEPRSPHFDAAPSGAAVDGGEDADVEQFERDGETRTGDRGFEPGQLLVSGDQDAADALCESLHDRPDVAAAVEHGDAEGLEDGAAPGYGGGGLLGGEHGMVEAKGLEGEDGE